MLNTIIMVLHMALTVVTPVHHSDSKVSERIITESANGEQLRSRQVRHMWRDESKRTTVYPGHEFNDARGNHVIVEDITVTEIAR
jgi:hypothetical protein